MMTRSVWETVPRLAHVAWGIRGLCTRTCDVRVRCLHSVDTQRVFNPIAEGHFVRPPVLWY